MKRKQVRMVLALVAVAATTLQTQAQSSRTAYPHMAPIDQYLIANRNAEIALARSAAPESISDQAEVMVRKALQAFIEADAEMAESVLSMDDNVDKLNSNAHVTLLALMKKEPAVAGQAVSALMISRALERVADHATNIAEDVIFWVRGADVRHHAGATAGDGAKK